MQMFSDYKQLIHLQCTMSSNFVNNSVICVMMSKFAHSKGITFQSI